MHCEIWRDTPNFWSAINAAHYEIRLVFSIYVAVLIAVMGGGALRSVQIQDASQCIVWRDLEVCSFQKDVKLHMLKKEGHSLARIGSCRDTSNSDGIPDISRLLRQDRNESGYNLLVCSLEKRVAADKYSTRKDAS